MDPSKAYFPESYVEARHWFRRQQGRIRQFWPAATLECQALSHSPELTIDWIEAACPSPEGQMLIVTTALHGAEGFTGTAVLHQLLEDFLDKFDHAQTGLLLIHAVNPWGMHHRRRTNASNVDLNRNFRFGIGSPTVFSNPGYHSLRPILHPTRPPAHLSLETMRFIVGVLGRILSNGIAQIKAATLLGQLEDPAGLYFGGLDFQEESQVVWGLVTNQIAEYRQIVHLDIHSGYGPRNEMNLVNSVRDPTPPEAWKQRFNYAHIVRADPEAFYTMQGDMIDAFYAWTSQNASHHRYFGTAFEFGTMGAGLLAQFRSLRAMVFENQTRQHALDAEATATSVFHEFKQLFDPPSSDWRRAATLSSHQALSGILKAFGCLSSH